LSGVNSSATNGWNGIEGGTSGTGAGVYGLHLPNTGTGTGVRGYSNSVDGVGVRGARINTGGIIGWGGLFQNDLGYTGFFGAASDIKTKKDVNGIDDALGIILSLNPVTYKFDMEKYPYLGLNTEMEYGFIAQELAEILPELVRVKKLDKNACKVQNKKSLTKADYEEFAMVDYTRIIPINTKAIQEQQIQITELQGQLEDKINIDITNLIPLRIIASPTARLDAEDLFVADENSKAYVIGVLNQDNNGTLEIQTTGIVEIEVDNSNGLITAGDFVTVSNLGKAIKSLTSEWVIGVAVSNQMNGLVKVRIDIRFKQ